MLFATLAGCEDGSRRAIPTATADPATEVTRWARAVDSVSTGMSPREFAFPSRSTEGGTGRFFLLADSSIRIDIEDLGEIGKHRERYYARDAVLRLAVSSNDRYDSPLSGRIVRSAVDSVWFDGDSAVRWVDSVQCFAPVRIQRPTHMGPRCVINSFGRSVWQARNRTQAAALTRALPASAGVA
jgi:hypothetical protein